MRNSNEAFFLGSTYGSMPAGTPFLREIYIARTDGSGFSRVAHTRSTGAADSYWSEPRASASMDGRYAAFSSDNGSSQIDVFIVKLPS